MIVRTDDLKRHHRISWYLWIAQAVCLFITFVMGVAPALFGCLILALVMGLRGDKYSDEY
jgi:hypothetical protein